MQESAPRTDNPSTSGPTIPASKLGWGPIFCVLAAVLWSTSAFFARASEFERWPLEYRGAAIAFWRAIFALAILLPMVRRVDWSWRLLPMTICFALMNWTYLTALVGGPPANAIWLQNLAPAWVMLAVFFWFREPTTRNDWWMLSCCIAGVLFILGMEMTHADASPSDRWWSPWLAIASGLLYAGVILSLRSLRSFDSAWLIALNHLVTALVMLPLVWSSGVEFPSGSMCPF